MLHDDDVEGRWGVGGSCFVDCVARACEERGAGFQEAGRVGDGGRRVGQRVLDVDCEEGGAGHGGVLGWGGQLGEGEERMRRACGERGESEGWALGWSLVRRIVWSGGWCKDRMVA